MKDKKQKMGIPSYFSYIIKNHSGIVSTSVQTIIHRLYMDCNSILYDAYHSFTSEKEEEREEYIIDYTIQKIKDYIGKIKPIECVFVAFDGVAPMAKMEQQRNRRYKSWFESDMKQMIHEKEGKETMHTTCIFTPGTLFMKRLSEKINNEFIGKVNHYQIIVSTPEEPGEGEHKLFVHLRKNPTLHPIAIYGLDADLLMLSLCHLHVCPSIYVFREAPQFAQVLLLENPQEKEKEEPFFLHIGKLGRSITHEMKVSCTHPRRMYDYVFLCFFLGNDFLPHFPSLNIRTFGIQRLLDVYRKYIGNKPHCFLLSDDSEKKIVWRELTKFIQELAKQEHEFIKQEYEYRNKRTFTFTKNKTIEEREELFLNTPLIYRGEEIYICPSEKGWEERYYLSLFHNIDISEVCSHYLDGLEWVRGYYFGDGDIRWKWKYPYAYPPLLQDLIKHLHSNPNLDIRKNREVDEKPFHPYTQLSYVVPPVFQERLLPPSVYLYLQKWVNIIPKEYLQFKWAFKRYFWESHVVLPEISNETMEE
jgi:5'-3' exonuclease